MEKEIPKYRVVYRPGLTDENDPMNEYLEKINILADIGYQIHTFTYDCSLMSLPEEKYRGVIGLEDVPPNKVNSYLDNGWEIASASISTKFVRMVKRRTD